MTVSEGTNANRLLEKCLEYGVLSENYPDNILELDLIESGVVDSMSVAILEEMVYQEHGLAISSQQFVVELRSLNALSTYIENV